MKHPLYILLGTVACAYLATANLRGWSLLQSASPTRWVPGFSGFHHK